MSDQAFCTDDEYRDLLYQLDQQTQEAEHIPYPEARDLLFDLLQNFDRMHREALLRMVHMIDQKSPALLGHLKTDFAIRTLLTLYDLAEAEPDLPEPDKNSPVGFVPLHEVRLLTPVKKTIWMDGGKIEDIKPGRLYRKEIDGKHLLLCSIYGELIAVKNACVDSMLPLDHGQLEAHFLICPWHGCQYNLLSGELMDAPGVKLEKYPVQVAEDGQFQVEILLN